MTASDEGRKKERYSTLDQVTMGFLAAALLLIIVPGFANLGHVREARREAAQCRANLEEIVEALDRYARVHRDTYPRRLEELVPHYLEAVPTCPAAEGGDYTYLYDRAAVNYTLYCKGLRHEDAGLGHNRPACTLDRGFLP